MTSSEDKTYVTMRCIECPSFDCTICPIGSWVSVDSLRGCTRLVDEDLAARYCHDKDEELPFLRGRRKAECLDEISAIESQILDAPLGRVLDEKGKVTKYLSKDS